jgi:hypothetical protein
MLNYVRPYWLQAKLTRPELQRVRVDLHCDDKGYREEMGAFLTAVQRGEPSVTSAENGKRDLEIVLCAYEAMKTRRPVAIPPA